MEEAPSPVSPFVVADAASICFNYEKNKQTPTIGSTHISPLNLSQKMGILFKYFTEFE